MALVVSHTTLNAHDAHALSVWWADLLGYADDQEDPNEPGHEECLILSPDRRHAILFIQAEELGESRRMHFDLASADRTRDEEIDRALALGATEVADRRTEDGRGWMVLADPEGNHFCIVRGPVDRAAAGDPPYVLPA